MPALFGLVAQGLDQVAATPLPQSQVMHPTGVVGGDAGGVANHKQADLVTDGKIYDLPGSLVVGLVNSAPVAGLDPP